MPVPPRALPPVLPRQQLSIRTLDTHVRRRPPREPEEHVRAEFNEMRGLSLTLPQATRLFALEPEQCGHLLARLVDEGFLFRSSDGRFRRPTAA